MALPLQLFSLLLYCVQQLGMMLGAGGETVLLVAYLIAISDNIIDKEDERFATTVRKVVDAGLFFITVSGIGITAVHAVIGQLGVVLEPVYLFKWLLIAALLAAAVAHRRELLSQSSIEGLIGGTWFALFVVHILAPVSGWGTLAILFAAWMFFFMLCWFAVVRLVRGKPKNTGTPAQKTPPAAAAKPVPLSVPAPVLAKRIPAPAPVLAALPKAPVAAPPPVPKIEKPTAPSVPQPQPARTPVPQPAPVFTNLDTLESFPYKTTPKVDTPMLHPHLTNESADKLPTPPMPDEEQDKLQLKHADATPHLPAVRIMPRKPEDLEGDHHMAPIVKYG